ncbi:hypothetical protein Peur_009152 [Populus x canadensis]
MKKKRGNLNLSLLQAAAAPPSLDPLVSSPSPISTSRCPQTQPRPHCPEDNLSAITLYLPKIKPNSCPPLVLIFLSSRPHFHSPRFLSSSTFHPTTHTALISSFFSQTRAASSASHSPLAI